METGENGISDGSKYGLMVSLVDTSSRQPENPNVALARQLVLAHGWNSTSFQIVNPGICRWFSAAGDAVVGYVESNGVRVVAGAPVCEKNRLSSVVNEFEAETQKDGGSVCYFAAEARLESIADRAGDHAKFLLGAQPVWQPVDWPTIVASKRSIRAQLNRARNKGVTVAEWPAERAHNHPELSECLRQWLDSKGLPPLHFMVETDTLSRLENRRIFVAKQAEHVIGFIVLSPVAKRNGWLFEQFPHLPGAPNGTVEMMIDHAMRAVARDGSEYATLGLSPLSKRADVRPVGEPWWLRFLLAWMRKHGQRFYNFDGLDAFKAKLMPDKWEPVFAISAGTKVNLRTLYAIAGAFSGGATIRLMGGGLLRAIATEFRWVKERILR